MTLEYFKQLVNKTQAKIPTELESIYKYLGITDNGSFLRSAITDSIYILIKDSLFADNDEDHIKLVEFLKLKDELVFREVLYSESSEEYLEIVNVIQDACRHKLKYIQSSSSQKQWESAIQYAIDYLKFSPNTNLIYDNLRAEYPKAYDRAVSAKKLGELGCTIEIKNADIIINGLNKIYQEISDKVKSVGGLSLASFIFSYLGEKDYSELFERYKITRSVSTMENDQQPQVPFGYLLNLCVKYPYFVKKKADYRTEIQQIIDLATITTNGVYGAQPYSQWESIFLDGDKIIKFLSNIALWDSMYSIPQSKPASAIEITFGIFNPLPDETFHKDFGFSKNEVKLVAQKVYEQIKNIKGPVIINLEKLDKNLYRIKRNKIENILNVMSHIQSANKEYFEPSDYLKIDFNFKPFIKTGKLKYLVMDKSWCSPSYFESIAGKIRESNKNLDQQLGPNGVFYA